MAFASVNPGNPYRFEYQAIDPTERREKTVADVLEANAADNREAGFDAAAVESCRAPTADLGAAVLNAVAANRGSAILYS